MQKTSDILWQDTQHQVLFEIIDLLQDEAQGENILHKLNHYMENHFTLEETYMRTLNYPAYEAHLTAHNSFRKELRTMVREDYPHDLQTRQMLSTFLRQWLKLHVFGIDKQLEAFIVQRGRF